MEAAAQGHVAIVKYLVSVGADISSKAASGETATHFALKGGYNKIVDILLDAMNERRSEDNKRTQNGKSS